MRSIRVADRRNRVTGATVDARRSRFSSPYADRIATLIMLLLMPALIMPLAGANAVELHLTATPMFSATQISRLAGSDRYATAAAISKSRFGSGAATVFIATGASFPDALAGAPAAARAKAPILLTARNDLPSATAAELARLKPSKIVLLGGSGVVSDAVASKLRGYAGTVVRWAGANRFETAAAISRSTFAAGVGVAYLATADTFPDALSGGAVAGRAGGPILLVNRTSVPAATGAELARLKPAKIVVLGGTSVVSDGVRVAVDRYTAGPVSRLSGADRYSTSVQISRSAYGSTGSAFIATGTNFSDGLAGGPVAALLPGPLLLVAPSQLPSVVKSELQRLGPDRVFILGGSGAVSDTVVNQIDAALAEALSTAAPTVTPSPAAAPTAVPAATPPPSALPMPAPSAPTCSGCIAVPSAIDPTGVTNASALLQSFLATVPDGATIIFPAGATYRMDAGLLIQDRRDLTFVGNGATLSSGPNGTGQQVESLFYLGGLPIRPSSGITIRGFNLVGNSPQPGVYLLGQPEFASGITILGGSDIEVDAVTVSGVFGDGFNANGGADGVWVHDSHVISNGRNGVSVIAASNVIVERTRFDRSGYSTFDIEPWDTGTAVRNIRFLANTAGTWTNSFLSANGNAGTSIDGITVSGNTVTGKSLLTVIDLTDRRRNVVFTNNRSLVATFGPVLRLAHIDGLTVTGNVQPLTSGSFASITDSTGVVYQP